MNKTKAMQDSVSYFCLEETEKARIIGMRAAIGSLSPSYTTFLYLYLQLGYASPLLFIATSRIFSSSRPFLFLSLFAYI